MCVLQLRGPDQASLCLTSLCSGPWASGTVDQGRRHGQSMSARRASVLGHLSSLRPHCSNCPTCGGGGEGGCWQESGGFCTVSHSLSPPSLIHFSHNRTLPHKGGLHSYTRINIPHTIKSPLIHITKAFICKEHFSVGSNEKFTQNMCVCVPIGNKKFDLLFLVRISSQVSTFALFLLKHSQFTTVY